MRGRISLVVPTWNGAAHLGETLESGLAQSRKPAEIVVCDDASTDGTVALARAVCGERAGVHAHRRRLGIPGNWTRALAVARGEYVLLLLQDDLLAPSALEGLGAALDAHPDAAFAFSRRALRREAETGPAAFLLGGSYPVLQEAFYGSLQGPLHGAALVRAALAAGRDLTVNVIGEPSFVLVRRSALLAVGGFDPRLRQLVDWELWLRLAAWGPCAFVDESLGTFRIHAGAQSARASGSPRIPWEYLRVLATVLREYGRELTPDERTAVRNEEGRAQRHLFGQTLRWLSGPRWWRA